MLTKYFDIEHVIHSLKTSIACIVGLLLSKIIGFQADQWVVITIIVVMCAQIYVGSVLQKAYLRFVGTCLGCLFAVTAIEFIDDSLLTIALTVATSSFVFSYIATSKEKYSYAGTLGAVTTAIILLGQTPSVNFALQRFFEITVGLLIATIISQFVLPIHARTHLRRTQAATLKQLSDLYTEIMMKPRSDTFIMSYLELDETIVKSLSRQRQLTSESKREPKGSAYDPDNFMHAFYCEKEILRAIDFMNCAINHFTEEQKSFLSSDTMKHFNNEIIEALNQIIKVIGSGNPVGIIIHIPSLENVKIASTRDIYVDSFIFSAEVLTENLGKLAAQYHISIHDEKPRQ